MAITKKPAKTMGFTTDSAADTFISSAPDAVASSPRRVRKGHKVQISLTINEPLLERVDQLADRLGQSRAAVISLAVAQALQTGLRIESSD